ncbi:HEXXH motif domain-containing protein [Streptomyces sp. NBC_01381]|uniref:HEXXH motif domain-containing protein n=1 Tax=Streptomyces sp. NBC_01381 TaxID=2903845 RepID=UPI00225B4FDC|nr:HEXXH motif domain-containing protein [Streptomyces sp. NBC_01381]MCX4673149.1 HEXXH motif domain-containing protein [Streptomyces sp. NBC_01381]
MHLDTQPHRVAPKPYGDLLSGACGPDAVASLRSAERSWRLLLLRALIDAADGTPTASLASLDDGWQLLTRAWEADPEPVERLLLYPAVGTWAAYALRRVRGAVTGDSPLWVELGRLHAVAASAAVLAGLDFRTSVPVRDGWVVLPMLGGARVAQTDRWGTVEVSSEAGAVMVGDVRRDGPGWSPLRELSADGCTLVLDDLDPHRGLRAPQPPHPLDTADRWSALFADAWELLARHDPEGARAASCGLSSVVPRPRAERHRPNSASSGDAFGAVLVSEPDDAEQFAATLVHEFQHNKLSAFMHLFTLYDDGGEERFYAPWRDDPRPLGGLLQGVYAFFGVARFWRHRQGPTAQFEYALWRAQTLRALHGIRGADRLTDLGRELVDELTGRLTAWQDEPVDPRARDAAHLAAADHHATWRAHHVRPDLDEVTRAAAAYAARSGPVRLPPRGKNTIAAARPERGLDTRAVLLRRLLDDPEGLRALSAAPGAVVEGARPEDVALLTGDVDGARQSFEARVRAGSAAPDAWVGLGLALRAEQHTAAQVLLTRPEFVMAVHAELGGGDPVHLASSFRS